MADWSIVNEILNDNNGDCSGLSVSEAVAKLVGVLNCVASLQSKEDGSEKQNLVKQCCDAMRLLFKVAGVVESLASTPLGLTLYSQGMLHEEKEIKKVGVFALNLTINTAGLNLANSLEETLVTCIEGDDIWLSDACVKFLVDVAKKHNSVPEWILKKPTGGNACSSVVFLRWCALGAEIAGVSEKLFGICIQSNILNSLLKSVKGLLFADDPLSRLNAIELLHPVARTKVGRSYLFSEGPSSTVETLRSLTRPNPDDPFWELLRDGAIRSLVQIFLCEASSASSDSQEFVKLLDTFKDCIDCNTCIEAVGMLAGASHIYLEKVLSHSQNRFLQMWLSNLLSATEATKATSLYALSNAIRQGANLPLGKSQGEAWEARHEPPDIKQQLSRPVTENNILASGLCQKLVVGVHGIISRPLAGEDEISKCIVVVQAMLRQANNPSVPVRCAVYSVLRAFASQTKEWGLISLFRDQNFLGFLHDRTLEPDTQGKQWKFAVVEGIVNSKHSSNLDILQTKELELLKRYLKLGPYTNKRADNLRNPPKVMEGAV